MAAKRHMDIKCKITGHNIIIADITAVSTKELLTKASIILIIAKILEETYRNKIEPVVMKLILDFIKARAKATC